MLYVVFFIKVCGKNHQKCYRKSGFRKSYRPNYCPFILGDIAVKTQRFQKHCGYLILTYRRKNVGNRQQFQIENQRNRLDFPTIGFFELPLVTIQEGST